eukprot:403364343
MGTSDSSDSESQNKKNQKSKPIKNAFDRKEYEGDKGHLLLQLQKTYKGDDRFQLTRDFDIDKSKKKSLPEAMLGAMNQLEFDLLDDRIEKKPKKVKKENEEEQEDNIQWDPELNPDKEKINALMILGTIVPQSEIFLKAGHGDNQKKSTLHIKRFDPRNVNNQHLIRKEEEKDEIKDKKELGKLEIIKKVETNQKYLQQYSSKSNDYQNEENNEDEENTQKVIDIKANSWKNITKNKKDALNNSKNTEDKTDMNDEKPQQNQVFGKSDFFLSFDDAPTKKVEPKTDIKNGHKQDKKLKNKPIDHESKNNKRQKLDEAEDQNILQEDQAEETTIKQTEKPKKEKKEKPDKKSKNEPKERVPFDELPNKLKKRIEKRNAKREQLKAHKQMKINLDQPHDVLVGKYKKIYGEQMSDEKLEEYVKYQKLIHDAKILMGKITQQFKKIFKRNSSASSNGPNWFAQLDESKAPNVKQYLQKPYNYYNYWVALIGAFMFVKYVKKNFTQTEFDMRKRPNMFIPKFIYRIRREHYVYWEISRLARGLPKTFTYSNWDVTARMMYHVDLEGRMLFEKINFREERIDLLENPLLGPSLRRKQQLIEDELMAKRASQMAIYYLNLHKRYDLDNYLQYKPITAMDWIRAFYFTFMTYTGLADTYRNEQYFPKIDIFYNFERYMIAMNFANPDTSKTARNILVYHNCMIESIIEWLAGENENQKEVQTA